MQKVSFLPHCAFGNNPMASELLEMEKCHRESAREGTFTHCGRVTPGGSWLERSGTFWGYPQRGKFTPRCLLSQRILTGWFHNPWLQFPRWFAKCALTGTGSSSGGDEEGWEVDGMGWKFPLARVTTEGLPGGIRVSLAGRWTTLPTWWGTLTLDVLYLLSGSALAGRKMKKLAFGSMKEISSNQWEIRAGSSEPCGLSCIL